MSPRAQPLRLAGTEDLVERGARSDAWVATHADALDFDEFTAGVFPRFAERASGSRIRDVDGNEYVDYVLGFGTVVLGHADRRVNDAVARELANGTCLSPLWRATQVELTEVLTKVVPNAELVYLLRTGSDATTAAVRLARAFTGRSKVLRWGYHGWHDWATPRPEGVPPAARADTLSFAYNDLPSVRAAFEDVGEEIACVIMMPYELEAPADGFLESVRSLAHAHGALFVLDEMRFGFRLALGGAQERFGVDADLVTVGKAMSNGYVLSGLAGREDVMRGLGRTHLESTYFANSAEMAAAIATIGVLSDTDALARIWRAGERFLAGLDGLAAELEVPARAVGLPPTPFLEFTEPDPELRNVMRATFFTETVRRGVLFEPGHHWFVSAAHRDEEIEETLDACRAAFLAVKETAFASARTGG